MPHPAPVCVHGKVERKGVTGSWDKESKKDEVMLDEQTGQTKRQTLVLIDGQAIIHRAFHAVPEDLTTSKGEAVNATFGFTSILLKALTDPSMKPDSPALAFPPFLSLLGLLEWENPGSVPTQLPKAERTTSTK